MPRRGVPSPVITGGSVGGQRGVAVIIPGGPSVSVGAAPRWEPVDLKRNIDGRLVTIIEEKLGQKKGEEFDRCFMQGQVAAHVHMLATLEVVRSQVSPQLKPILDEAVYVTQKHLRHAESLVTTLESKESL